MPRARVLATPYNPSTASYWMRDRRPAFDSALHVATQVYPESVTAFAPAVAHMAVALYTARYSTRQQQFAQKTQTVARHARCALARLADVIRRTLDEVGEVDPSVDLICLCLGAVSRYDIARVRHGRIFALQSASWSPGAPTTSCLLAESREGGLGAPCTRLEYICVRRFAGTCRRL